MVGNAQQIGVENKGDYLLVTLQPYQSEKQMEAQIGAMYDAVERHHAPRLLVDCRATRKLIPVFELYELCLYLVSKFLPLGPRMAVFASPEAVYPDRFGENVVRNRGLNFIRFVDNEQTALAWLVGHQTEPPRS
jgi:hypothetical protein